MRSINLLVLLLCVAAFTLSDAKKLMKMKNSALQITSKQEENAENAEAVEESDAQANQTSTGNQLEAYNVTSFDLSTAKGVLYILTADNSVQYHNFGDDTTGTLVDGLSRATKIFQDADRNKFFVLDDGPADDENESLIHVYSYSVNDDGYTITLDKDNVNTLHLGYNIDDLSYEPFDELPEDNYAFIFTSGGFIYSWVSFQESPDYGYVDNLFSGKNIGKPQHIDLIDTSAFWLSEDDGTSYLYKGNIGTNFGSHFINGPNMTVSVLFGTSDTVIWASFEGNVKAFKYVSTSDTNFVFFSTEEGVFAGDLTEHQNVEITQLNATAANASDIEIYQNLVFATDALNSAAIVYNTYSGIQEFVDLKGEPLDLLLGNTFGTEVEAKAAQISHEKASTGGSTKGFGVLGAAVNMIALTVVTLVYTLL